MTSRHYIGVIETGEQGYGIYFPDFPGCVSGGESLEDVIAMGTEALNLHIEAMTEDAQDIPEPSHVDLARERFENPDAKLDMLVPVAVDVSAFPDRVSVEMKTSIIREINEIMKQGETVSRVQFLEQAARRELDRLKQSA